MTAVSVYSYTQSVTYVSDNILKSLKDVIRLSGLSPEKLAGEWSILLRGISTWLESEHLETVTLEIYDPATDGLITRWDVSISYTWDTDAGNFWTDTDQLRYAIQKAGVIPSQANYRVIVQNKPGRPYVDGWSDASYRSTDGMVRQSLGKTIDHCGLGGSASYWRNG